MAYVNQSPIYSQLVQTIQKVQNTPNVCSIPVLKENYGDRGEVRAGGSYNQFLPDDSPNDTQDCCGCVVLKMTTWNTPYNDAMSECLNEGYCSRNVPPGYVYNCTGYGPNGNNGQTEMHVTDTARDDN